MHKQLKSLSIVAKYFIFVRGLAWCGIGFLTDLVGIFENKEQ